MNTGFACPACRAPLVLSCRATSAAVDTIDSTTDVAPCPNPFCRADLPARRHGMTLTYALVGTLREPPESAATLGARS